MTDQEHALTASTARATGEVLSPDRQGYGQPPEGYRWEWFDATDNRTLTWRLIPPGVDKRCRRTVYGHKACGRPAVAELDRGRQHREIWWAYCEHHLYGRRIRDGVIEEQRAVRIDEETADA